MFNSGGKNVASDTCLVCFGQIKDRTRTDACQHTFCYACIKEWSKVSRKCPFCRGSFDIIIRNVGSNLGHRMIRVFEEKSVGVLKTELDLLVARTTAIMDEADRLHEVGNHLSDRSKNVKEAIESFSSRKSESSSSYSFFYSSKVDLYINGNVANEMDKVVESMMAMMSVQRNRLSAFRLASASLEKVVDFFHKQPSFRPIRVYRSKKHMTKLRAIVGFVDDTLEEFPTISTRAEVVLDHVRMMCDWARGEIDTMESHLPDRERQLLASADVPAFLAGSRNRAF